MAKENLSWNDAILLGCCLYLKGNCSPSDMSFQQQDSSLLWGAERNSEAYMIQQVL